MKKEIFNDVYALNKRINNLPKGTQYKEYSTPEGFVLVLQEKGRTSSWTHESSLKRDNEIDETKEGMLEDAKRIGFFLTKAILSVMVIFACTKIMVG